MFGQGIFSNNNQSNGIFGNNQQKAQGNSTGLFGNNTMAASNNSFQSNIPAFSQNTNNGTGGGGIFGNTGAFNQNSTLNANNTNASIPFAGIAGIAGNQPNNPNIFGNNNFPSNTNQNFSNNQNTGAVFGNNNTANGGIFGQNTQQNVNTFSNQNNSINQGVFGQNNIGANTNATGLFGQTSNNTTSAFLGGTAPTNNNNYAKSPFAGFGNQTQNNLMGTATSGWNTAGTANNPLAGNKYGGTSWGVPTNQTESIQPVKCKNTKLDAKHMIKCISALDQFTGLSKEQIRISYILTGSQQIIIQSTTFAPNALSTLTQAKTTFPNNTPNTFTGLNINKNTTFPAFGTNQNNNPIFGQNPMSQGNTNSSIFGQPASSNNNSFMNPNAQFGQTNPPNNGIFGNQPQNLQVGQPLSGGQNNPLFGQTQPTTIFGSSQPNTAFGSNQSNSLFNASQQTLFGNPTSNAVFGQPNQTNTGVFNQNTSLFGQPANTGNGLGFGQNNPQNSLFGAPGQPSFNNQNSFGLGNNGNLGNSGNNNSNFGLGNNSSLFGQPGLQNVNSDILANFLNQLVSMGGIYSQKFKTVPQQTPFDEMISKGKAESKTSPSEVSLAIKMQNYDFYTPDIEDQIYEEQFFTKKSHQSKIKLNYVPLKDTRKSQKSQPLFNDKELTRISENLKESKRKTKFNNLMREEDWPTLSHLQIVQPSFQQIKKMTEEQARKIEQLIIGNQYGQVKFLGPVSIFQKNIDHCIQISQDAIEIVDSEWETRPCQMTFFNFGNYKNLKSHQQAKIEKKMEKWIEKMSMKLINHDKTTGNLKVQIE